MASQWNYLQNNQPQGPVAEESLKAMLASGALGWDVLVWCEGMAGWTAAGQIPELKANPPAPSNQGFARIQLDLPEAEPSNPYAAPRAAMTGFSVENPSAGEVAPDLVDVLRQTKPWVRFLAVLGFIGIGFMVLASVAMLGLGSVAGNRGLPAGFGIGMMLLYLFMAGIQLPAAIFLNRYASRIGTLLDSHAPGDLGDALIAQKSFWRYTGILTAAVLCLYALAIVIGIAVAMVSMAGKTH